MVHRNYLSELYSVENKVALVIGGGGHLCSQMVYGLVNAGAYVVVADIRKEKADEFVSSLPEFRDKLFAVGLDAAEKEDHVKVLETIIKKYNSLDIVINGAGTNGATPFFEISKDEWFAILNSQITATFFGCQVYGGYMVEQRKGSIINISSASAGPPLSKAFTYSVAKAGIKNLTQNLAREWAQSNVRVNAIRPGFFPTDWNRKNFITPDRERAILNHTPMNRYGSPNELIGAILWLASNASSFVTGAEITVDGGFSCMTI